jgi:hypothetical protein
LSMNFSSSPCLVAASHRTIQFLFSFGVPIPMVSTPFNKSMAVSHSALALNTKMVRSLSLVVVRDFSSSMPGEPVGSCPLSTFWATAQTLSVPAQNYLLTEVVYTARWSVSTAFRVSALLPKELVASGSPQARTAISPMFLDWMFLKRRNK